MKFRDQEHKQFYRHSFEAPESVNDGNHRGLFYMLGLFPETRRNISDLYDYDRGAILPGGLTQPWHTDSSARATRLAFNLFNGFSGFSGERQIEPASQYTPDKLFDTTLFQYYLEACRIRYGYLWYSEREPSDDEFEDFNISLDSLNFD